MIIARVGMGVYPPMTAPSYISGHAVAGITIPSGHATGKGDLLGKSGLKCLRHFFARLNIRYTVL